MGDVKLHNSADSKSLLNYIKDLTELYSSAAQKNEDALKRIGFTSEEIEEIYKESGINELVSLTEEDNATDLLLSINGLSQNATGSISKVLKDRLLNRKINELIAKCNHEVKSLKEYNSLLKRLLNNDQVTRPACSDPNEDSSIALYNLIEEIKEYERKIEELTNNTDNNWINIIEDIKMKSKSVEDNISKIEKFNTTKSEEYNNFPPDLLQSKLKLAELVQHIEVVQQQINDLTKH